MFFSFFLLLVVVVGCFFSSLSVRVFLHSTSPVMCVSFFPPAVIHVISKRFKRFLDVRRGIRQQMLFLRPFFQHTFRSKISLKRTPERYMWMALPAFGLFLPSPMWHMKRQAAVNVKTTSQRVLWQSIREGKLTKC